tara:strand:- start:1484 stop:2095 length:612 start_codon:yes stop_codon:yes gene_type:complete
MKRMVDLFSGLGGASESMLNNGWEVLRIEQNAELSLVPNTQIMSVEDFGKEVEKHIKQGYNFDQPNLIWASPPCTDFSDGFSSPKSKAGRAGEDYYPNDAIELVKETKRIIDMINPQYYIIENVRGAIKYLTPILGEPSLIIDSIVLWGRFPIWAMPPGYKHIKADPWSKDPLRANKRALIPYAVSDACRQSIEHTKTLDYWF